MPRAPSQPAFATLPEADRTSLVAEQNPIGRAVRESPSVVTCTPSRGWRIYLTQNDAQLQRGVVTVWIRGAGNAIQTLFQEYGMRVEGVAYDPVSDALVYDSVDNLALAFEIINACRSLTTQSRPPTFRWSGPIEAGSTLVDRPVAI